MKVVGPDPEPPPAADAAADQGLSPAAPSSAYAIYVLGLLTLIYVFYAMDRQAIVICQELIKAEFHISDTAMGLVTGTIYGVSYALAGLPFGWACDRMSRRTLMAAVVGAWSALTVVCGLSSSYLQLALARLGIGASEAGGAPVGMSILVSLFPAGRRAMVTGVFFSGAAAGGVVSFMAGGYVAAHYGWRAVFALYGLPGLLLAVAVLLTVREPPRAPRPAGRTNPLRDTWHILFRSGLAPLYLATGLHMFALSGTTTWMASFFMRAHHLSLTKTGLAVGIGSVFNAMGLIGAGALSDRARRWRAWGPMVVMVAGSLLYLTFGILVLSAQSTGWAVAALCGMGAMTLTQAGATHAAISEYAPAHARGAGFALYGLVTNVVGSGLGPLMVGAVSDRLGGGASSLRQAMLGVLLVELAAAGAFAFAGRDLAARGDPSGRPLAADG